MSWRCSQCGRSLPEHIYDKGAVACPPDGEPTDKDDDE